jgi:hypothetical protein
MRISSRLILAAAVLPLKTHKRFIPKARHGTRGGALFLTDEEVARFAKLNVTMQTSAQ